jgi:deazaflavin-dependent oxidoreductase (nitroreductase family)
MPLTGEYEPSPSDWARKQAELYERTNGEQGAELQGRPVVLVTSIGAKTGKLRKTPLMRVEHDGMYAVVASKGGDPHNPVWYHNLKKNPHVELQDRATKRDYTAREVFDDEKAVWWDRAVETWPDYANYQTKTSRQIPVFVLEPMTSATLEQMREQFATTPRSTSLSQELIHDRTDEARHEDEQ